MHAYEWRSFHFLSSFLYSFLLFCPFHSLTSIIIIFLCERKRRWRKGRTRRREERTEQIRCRGIVFLIFPVRCVRSTNFVLYELFVLFLFSRHVSHRTISHYSFLSQFLSHSISGRFLPVYFHHPVSFFSSCITTNNNHTFDIMSLRKNESNRQGTGTHNSHNRHRLH